MIPIDNSVAGRVADIHHLLPRSNLYIVGEHFLPVHHQLMLAPGADLSTVRTVHSHVHALGQCRKIMRELNLKPVVAADTAGAARELSQSLDSTRAAIATTAGGRDLWPQGGAREHRGRGAQHHPLRRPLAHAAGCRAGRPAGDHQLCLPCTECSGRALQGHGRLRHQRREHDQARILPARGPVLGHPVLCRHRGPPGRAQRPPGPGRARVLHRATCAFSASTRPRRSAPRSRAAWRCLNPPEAPGAPVHARWHRDWWPRAPADACGPASSGLPRGRTSAHPPAPCRPG